ncbi:MAG: MFS transporter [Candidatus Lokiarchaeota archaeon]|nr:MFS transporter [Candidatus Lokiarchaeota archaeon]
MKQKANDVLKSKENSGRSAKTKYPELSALWFGLFIDILGFYIIIPYLPSLIKTYNTTPLVIGLLLATNAVFTLFSAPIWGRLSDKFGRRPMLLIAEAGTCSAFLILAFSNSLNLLFVARIVDGIFGGNYPITKAIITDSVPPRDRGLQMTNLGVAHTLAGLVAPGLGGFLSVFPIFGPDFPLALPGLVAACLSFSTIIITFFFIKESWPKSKRQKVDKEIKIKLKLWNNKDALYLLTQFAFHTFSFIMYVSTLAIFIALILGLDTLGVSLLLTISGISRAIVRFTVFKTTLRLLGEKKMKILGLSILVITFILVGIFGAFYPEWWIFIVLMVVASYGVSCARGLLMSKVTETVSPKEVGKINGYTSTLDSLAQIFGPIIGTLFMPNDPLLFGSVMGILAFVALMMAFKQIVPYREKVQFKDLEHTA